MKNLFLVLIVAGCHGNVSYEPVTIDGWPCPTGTLRDTIVVEASHGDYRTHVAYRGGRDVPAYMHQIMLDENAELSLKVRVGVCKTTQGGADCSDARWLLDDQRIDVDTRKPDPHMVVRFPTTLACST